MNKISYFLIVLCLVALTNCRWS